MFAVVDFFFRRIYRVKKWNVKFTPSPPTCQPLTALSPGPFKIDEQSNRLRF